MMHALNDIREFFAKNWHIPAIFGAGFVMLFSLMTAKAKAKPLCFPVQQIQRIMSGEFNARLVGVGTEREDGGQALLVYQGYFQNNKRIWIFTADPKSGYGCQVINAFNWSGKYDDDHKDDKPTPKGHGPKIEG